MGLIWSAIIGIAAGFFVGTIMKGKGLGLIVNLVAGITGALLGSWVFEFLAVRDETPYKQLLMAMLGAITLLWILSFFEKKKKKKPDNKKSGHVIREKA